MGETYVSIEAAVEALRPGWKPIASKPYNETVPNDDPERLPSAPSTISKQTGTLVSIKGPNGEADEIIVSMPIPSTTREGRPTFTIIRGPSANAPTSTKAATPAAGLERLDANLQPVQPGQTAVYVRDPNAPAGTSPFKIEPGNETGDPSKWTVIPADPSDAEGAKLVYDPASKKVIATVPATAGSRATGEYANVIDPNDPDKKRVIGLKDTGSNQIFSVSRDPNLQKQIVTTPNKVFVFNDDGSVANTIDVTPNMPPTVFTMGNTAFVFDPKAAPGSQITKGPSVEEPATVGVSTQNEFYVFFDKDGKEVSRVKNPNFQGPPQTTQGTQSATAPFVQQWNQKSGQWEWVENKGRVTIGQATQQLIKDLTGQTVDPNNPLTLEEANTLLTTAINKMNADAQQATTATTAAGDILSTQAQGAQTGAGMLQQRATTAQNLVQQGLGLAQSTGGRYGNYSGGILNPMPGFGQALTQGAAGYATELGGGQEVFDTAVRMVQAADPNNSNPDRAAAVGVLTQIMDRYKQATGQEFPTVTATRALAQSNANGGLAAPVTAAPAAVPAPATPNLFHATPIIVNAQGQNTWSYPFPGQIPQGQAQARSPAELGFTAPGGAMRFM